MVNGIDMKGTVFFKDCGKRKEAKFSFLDIFPIIDPRTGAHKYYVDIGPDFPITLYSLTVNPEDPLDRITVDNIPYFGEKLHQFYRKFYLIVSNRETEKALDAL